MGELTQPSSSRAERRAPRAGLFAGTEKEMEEVWIKELREKAGGRGVLVRLALSLKNLAGKRGGSGHSCLPL